MQKVTFTEIGPVAVGVVGRSLFLHQCDECGALVRFGHNETGIAQHIRWHHRMFELVEYPARMVHGEDLSREEPRA